MRAGVPADWGRRVLGGEIMAQGTRGRMANLGLGLIFCSGLVGCMDSDKKPLSTKPVGQGLPGTPLVNNGTPAGRPAAGGQPMNWSRDGQPVQNGYNAGGANPQSNGFQPTGGAQPFGQPNRNTGGAINNPTIPGYQPQPQQPYLPSVTPQSNLLPTNPAATAYRGQVDPQSLALNDLPYPPPARASNIPSVEPNPLAPVAPPMPGSNAGLPMAPGGLPSK